MVVFNLSLVYAYGEDPAYGTFYSQLNYKFKPNARSESLSASDGDDHDHYDYNYGDPTNVHPKLVKYEAIDAEPGFTHSYYYVSPQDLKARLARTRRAPAAAQKAPSDKENYENTYSKFLAENFPTRDHDPLSHIKAAEYKQKPEDAEEYDTGYTKPKFPSDEYERIKYLSDQQAKEIKKNPENCKVVIKGEMECQICHDAKSNSNSESCSYSSKPDHKKYAFHREKSYNSKDDDKNKGAGSKGQGKNTNAPKKPKAKANKSNGQKKANIQKQHKTHDNLKVAESRQPRDIVGLDPYLYGGEESEETEEAPKSYEGYYSHIFPSGEKSARIQAEKGDEEDEKQYEHLPGFNGRKDVDSVLAEFNKKDWSKCQKITKGDLTCYKCKDKNGANYEECMYISDSTPKKSRVIYEENKRFYEDADADAKSAGTASVAEVVDTPDEAEEDAADETVDSNKSKQRVVVKKRKLASDKSKEADLTPENDSETQSDEKQTFKRTISYTANSETDGKEDPDRSIRYEQSVSQSN